MKRILGIIYVVAVVVISIITAISQDYPALFWINIMAPNEGDTYGIKLVSLLTMLTLLLPYILLLVVSKLVRNSKVEIIEPGRTGIWIQRKKQFQSALVGIPVFINDKKAGVVDNGKLKFFDAPSGLLTIQTGEGKSASEKLELRIMEGDQLKFEMEIAQAGLGLKYILKKAD